MSGRRFLAGVPLTNSDVAHFCRNIVAAMPFSDGSWRAHDYLYGAIEKNSAKSATLLSAIGIVLAVALVDAQYRGFSPQLIGVLFAFFIASHWLIQNVMTVWFDIEPVIPTDDENYRDYITQLCRIACARVRRVFFALMAFTVGFLLLAFDLFTVILP